ncbi:hypothetical protein CMU89_00665 [Elizabethkingia anophelis]|nr:hypothetical protein [Elizabethkingia anophelis]MDV3541183.1 hypothetical protein [Elizabethkingia anophelis]PKR31552.1 hypothetical protein CWH99_12370 [Elizabethkingia anophelis]PKR33839.1 hypothetical protein CWI00_17015 [Elizabethkingia anophelis]PRQ78331.1 hypothetical protein CMT60_18940 [Elizabethkingia anophelis]
MLKKVMSSFCSTMVLKLYPHLLKFLQLLRERNLNTSSMINLKREKPVILMVFLTNMESHTRDISVLIRNTGRFEFSFNNPAKEQQTNKKNPNKLNRKKL